MKPFQNLVFDIGNVLVDIDYDVTVREFQKLATVDFSTIVSYSKQHHIFDWFETGKITPEDFRQELRKFLREGVTDKEIDAAWNAIFLDYPKAKFELLKLLKDRYNTFALSNINALHVGFLDEVVRSRFQSSDFAAFFHRAYYSHEVGYRKPDRKIFELLLQKENLVPEKTFFVDDKEENVEAALKSGIKAYLLKDREKLGDLLLDLEII